jgi:KaiC/GvpD/RAD55 family RecA-like ATPase
MLDRILKNALDGITVIEEETGSVANILSKQLGGFAQAEGKKVGSISLETQEIEELEGTVTGIQGASGMEELVRQKRRHGSEVSGNGEEYGLLGVPDYDLIIIESLSTYLFDKSEKQAVDLINRIGKLSHVEKKAFIVTFDKALVTSRLAAFLEAMADSVIVIHTEITSDRITRMLYIPKMRDSRPPERLIKITIDENGLQVDTREFVG